VCVFAKVLYQNNHKCYIDKHGLERGFYQYHSIVAVFINITAMLLFASAWMCIECLVSSRTVIKKGKGSSYLTTKCRVLELIPVPGSQPAGDVSHKPGGRLPLLSARPAVTPATLNRAATNFAAW